MDAQTLAQLGLGGALAYLIVREVLNFLRATRRHSDDLHKIRRVLDQIADDVQSTRDILAKEDPNGVKLCYRRQYPDPTPSLKDLSDSVRALHKALDRPQAFSQEPRERKRE